MSKLDNSALKSALEIISGLQNIEKEYGRDTLITVLESVGGFFGLVGVVNPESVDKQELESYITKNRPQKTDYNEVKKPGPYESDKPEQFGMYKELMGNEGRYTKYGHDEQRDYKIAEHIIENYNE